MKIRSTRKLTARVCIAVAASLLTIGLLLGVGGCAANSSRDWAQTSPVIAPTYSGEPTLSLGVIEQGS